MNNDDTASYPRVLFGVLPKEWKLAGIIRTDAEWTGGDAGEGELKPLPTSLLTLWLILFPGSYLFLLLTDVIFCICLFFLKKLSGLAKKALEG